jgi:hypothetical protein
MRKKLLISSVLILSLAGCAQLKSFNSKAASAVETWWNSPATQQGLKIGLQAAGAALVSGAESAALDYFDDGQVHWTDVGKSAASGAIRSIELTATASQPAQAAAKVAQAVVDSSHDPAQAQATKTAVIAGLTAAQATGADPSGALEGVAQALDAQNTNNTTSLQNLGK